MYDTRSMTSLAGRRAGRTKAGWQGKEEEEAEEAAAAAAAAAEEEEAEEAEEEEAAVEAPVAAVVLVAGTLRIRVSRRQHRTPAAPQGRRPPDRVARRSRRRSRRVASRASGQT